MAIGIGRREFIGALGGVAVAWPLAARAQQAGHIPRVGILMSGAESDPEQKAWLSAFVQGLASLGRTASQNVQIETRWAAGNPTLIKALAAELVELKPDAIVTTGMVNLLAVHQKTQSIPIVFAQVSDPVGSGVVASLAHPGGNITGFANYEYTIAGKWLDLLRELVPRIGRVLVIMDPDNSAHPGYVSAVENVAGLASIQVTTARVRGADDIEHTVDTFVPGADAGLIVLPDLVTVVHRDLIFNLAALHRAPAIYPYPFFAVDGGLIAYGIDGVTLYRSVAAYVDRILKGAKPADLPIQLPTKFELVVNLTTAKTLGLEIPPKLLAIADEVIE